MQLPKKLADVIAERLERIGDFGVLKLTVKHGRVAEIETTTSERMPEAA